MNVFVDTSAFYALLDEDNRGHREVASVWLRLIGDNVPLVTSNYVVLETSALLQKRLGLSAVRKLYEEILPATTILYVDEFVHSAGVSAVLAAGRRDSSLVDCTSFVLIHRHGIKRAFALDSHFQEQGLEVLP